ncbi:hypothetical protein MLD38_016625 [Melastoma candidum]|uniref:Uncharacterized protein n=1 Tax=Melastoma candidum TaxID=119954 RepID=A0ACB9QMA6_9MYRT|nr:hypothetical protein MLD38_016625 [Melastoma candidum]
MDQLKTQLAQAYAEEFLETVRGKCFEKCITKPGSSLSGSESSCISRCLGRGVAREFQFHVYWLFLIGEHHHCPLLPLHHCL